MKQVMIALPDQDFDPTEAAVPWRALTEAGHQVHFATGSGQPSACDPDMLSGVLFGLVRALDHHQRDYQRMVESHAFQHPATYADIHPDQHDLLVLPGGHAPAMRQYLEATDLQRAVARFAKSDHMIGAICHGLIVLARTQHNERSILHGRTVTTLPKRFEVGAWALTKPTHGDYFRTYPEWVQDEVERALGPDGTCVTGPFLPLHGEGFVVEQGNLITARWPGDAERFAAALVERLA